MPTKKSHKGKVTNTFYILLEKEESRISLTVLSKSDPRFKDLTRSFRRKNHLYAENVEEYFAKVIKLPVGKTNVIDQNKGKERIMSIENYLKTYYDEEY